ncbi:DUF7315 family membrane protein [Halorarum halobium]|uniref:DUF7315 family membrane protein n=1 Tax=Halorarum halobium TaxID=3075121 RepID=UPI0028AF20B5|nr:hypothetical protein [Halobaculum sp. XH14]
MTEDGGEAPGPAGEDEGPKPATESGDGGSTSGAGANDRRVRVTTDTRGSRDVVVPLRLYKTVTVFSTLIAVGCVVVGFALLDAATLQVSLVRDLLVDLIGVVGLSPGPGALTVTFALLGLAIIAFGAGVYVVGTRFRAEGMGNAQDDDAEESTNG